MNQNAFSILTEDETVFARFRQLGDEWAIHRLSGINSITQLKAGSIVVIDTSCRGLPAPQESGWPLWCQAYSLIVASSTANDEEGLRFLEAGVSGYCHAYAPPATLRQILEVVASGEQWVGRSLLNRLLRSLEKTRKQSETHWLSLLSERERAVARMAASGESNQSIADALNITERTVKAHLTSSFEKLGVSDRLQLALKVHGLKT